MPSQAVTIEIPSLACDISDYVADIFDFALADKLVADTPLRQVIKRRLYRRAFVESVKSDLKLLYPEPFALDAIALVAAGMVEKLGGGVGLTL